MSWAALFDWDGVVIDSREAHRASWDRLSVETGLPLPPGHFEEGFGRTNQVIIPEILAWTCDPDEVERLAARKEEIYREIALSGGIKPLPGVAETLARLRAAGIPAVVGSATPRVNIETLLPVLGLGGAFAGIVSGDDVRASKPDPEVFLKGAAIAGVLPHRCVVFEDAVFGIEAALRGGMAAVAVTTTHPREVLSRAHRIVDRLDELDLPDLEQLLPPAPASAQFPAP